MSDFPRGFALPFPDDTISRLFAYVLISYYIMCIQSLKQVIHLTPRFTIMKLLFIYIHTLKVIINKQCNRS